MKAPIWAAVFVASLIFLVFAFRRARTYLHVFQREKYQGSRFVGKLASYRAFDKRATMAIFLVGIFQFMGGISIGTAYLLTGAALLLLTLIERDPRRSSNNRLVTDGRAGRILWTALGLLTCFALVIALSGEVLLFILLVQFVPLALVGANLLTLPYERKIHKRSWKEAQAKLQSLKPTIIAITGSYGKTSTKHLLGHILEGQSPALVSPGSVETEADLAQVVLDRLEPQHRFLLCEMNAKTKGSLASLCRLAPPDAVIITAIGRASNQRLETLQAAAEANFEPAEAVAGRQGPVVAAEHVLRFDAARHFGESHPNFITVGTSADCTARILAVGQSAAGVQAEVLWRQKNYRLEAPLFGEPHIANMVLAFGAACSLGVTPEEAILAIASVPQISRRMELKSAPSGARIIDDSYGANPAGFGSALCLLNQLRLIEARRILVTPGVSELGAHQEQEHTRLGQMAGADVLVAIRAERMGSFIAAFAKANPAAIVVRVPTFAAAQQWLDSNLRARDTVLLESQLPETWESNLLL